MIEATAEPTTMSRSIATRNKSGFMLRFAGKESSAASFGGSLGKACRHSSLMPSKWLAWHATIEGNYHLQQVCSVPITGNFLCCQTGRGGQARLRPVEAIGHSAPFAPSFIDRLVSLVQPNLPARPGQAGDTDKLSAAVEQSRKLRPDRLERQRLRAVDAEWLAHDDVFAMLDPIDAVELGPCTRINLEIPPAIGERTANV